MNDFFRFFIPWKEDIDFHVHLLWRCSKSVPLGAYSNTIILVNGSSSSQYPIRLTKFLWLTLDKLVTWNHNRILKGWTLHTHSCYDAEKVSFKTFFLNWDSHCLDQSFADFILLAITAISTPLDNVPLYSTPSDNEPIILLKSSQAVSSSDLLSAGTPSIFIYHFMKLDKEIWKLVTALLIQVLLEYKVNPYSLESCSYRPPFFNKCTN